MIPENNYDLENADFITENTKSYKLIIKNNEITGFVDDIEALQQAIYKILNTERYIYPMYSRNYGIELKDLIGLPSDYVISQVEERITEALIYDDRIISVEDFVFAKNRSKIHVKFKVYTIYGDTNFDYELPF